MNKRLFLLTQSLALAVALIGAISSAIAAEGGSIEKFNGSIRASAGSKYNSLETINGSIKVDDDVVVKSVETVNGTIEIGNNVQFKSIETVNGRIDAGDNLVGHSIENVNGQISIGANSKISTYISNVSGGIRIGKNADIGEGIDSVNGSIFVDARGKVGKDIETVNGSIGIIETLVEGDVTTMSGNVTIGINSNVNGRVYVSKGNNSWFPAAVKKKPVVIIGPNARVVGNLVFDQPVILVIDKTATTGKIEGVEPTRVTKFNAK